MKLCIFLVSLAREFLLYNEVKYVEKFDSSITFTDNTRKILDILVMCFFNRYDFLVAHATILKIVECLAISARMTDFEFDCTGRQGMFADQRQDCKVYYSCNAFGKKTRLQCPNGQTFNERMSCHSTLNKSQEQSKLSRWLFTTNKVFLYQCHPCLKNFLTADKKQVCRLLEMHCLYIRREISVVFVFYWSFT